MNVCSRKIIIKANVREFHYSIAEVTCGIICGCLPALPAFFKHVSSINIKVLRTSRKRDQSKSPAWSPKTRQEKLKLVNSTIETAALSPTSLGKTLTHSCSSPTMSGWRDKSSNKHHWWEELDELEYVAGDNDRSAVEECNTTMPQSPPPVLK